MEKESEEQDDYGFAFDHPNFSDTVLRLEIESDFPETRASGRDEGMPNEQGHETAQEPETSSSVHCSVVRMETIDTSFRILAAKSPFIYRLFTNEKKDPVQQHVTLRIRASEEVALMDVLHFIDSNNLRSHTCKGLLDMLKAADKLEVSSCMRHCSQLLENLPMTFESALAYVDLPSEIRMAHTAQSLIDAAKKFLVTRFKEIDNCEEEVLNLPLSGFEAVISSEHIEPISEDYIFKFAIKWAERHYPELKDRREILSKRLLPCVRFPYMSCLGLREVLSRLETDIEPDLALAVTNALFYKAGESPYIDRSISIYPDGSRPLACRVAERSYKWRPIKIVELESPRQQRICYLDLTREECSHLPPSGGVFSQVFNIGPHCFILCGGCYSDSFGLFLKMVDKGSGALTINFESASRDKLSQDFHTKFRAKKMFCVGTCLVCPNLFHVPWSDFIAEDSPYFIDGVLHLRAGLKVKKKKTKVDSSK